ncbi:MAG TPA: hypothetical protein VGD78_09960 [Chthoniobacterales bacterium]
MDAETPEDPWRVHTVTREPMGPHSELIIDRLFPGNPLLRVAKTDGKRTDDFFTRRREDWRGLLSECALIVPNPMGKAFGTTKGGRVSADGVGRPFGRLRRRVRGL